MTRLLSLFGLMRVSEHERNVRALESQLVLRENAFETIEGERDRLSDKFKKAVAVLEKQAGEIEDLTADVAAERIRSQRYAQDAADLRPDALAMRRKRQMDRDLKAAKAAKKVQP